MAHICQRERGETRKGESVPLVESTDKYFNLGGMCLAEYFLTHKPNHLCFTAVEMRFKNGFNGIRKL